MTKRAVIYARVSTEEQGKGYSLRTQIDSCRQYAEGKGYVVVAEFTDMYTGTELDRPGLTELYQFVEGKTADVVIVHDIDRLSREVSNQAIIEMEMSRAGLKIEYALGQYAETPEGELLKLVKSGIAQYENRQRVERSRRGKRGRVEAGYVLMPTGRAPFGYDYISERHKGWLVVNEEQARVVRMMYEWLTVDGLSSYAIARKLFELGILTKGDTSEVVYKKDGPAAWSPATVRRIISNSVYKGLWHYGKRRRVRLGGRVVQVPVPEAEWISVAVPAIVDEQTWNRAQECLARNKEMSKRNTKREYLLRSLVFCPCGRRWTVVYKSHLKRSYYRCPTNEAEHWRHRCENRFSIRQEKLEEAVWSKVASFLLDPENLRLEIERHRANSKDEEIRTVQRLEAIDEAIAAVDRRMAVLLEEILSGGFSRAVVDEKKKQLADQRASLVADAERLHDQLRVAMITPDQEAEIDQFADELKDSFQEVTFEGKRRVLELMKLRIDVISRSRVRLTGVISSDGLFVDIASA